jgi:trehalose 6-phosphate phosphatase
MIRFISMDKKAQKIQLAEIISKRNLFAKSFFLTDYDGTLAPFKADREKAYPYPGIKELLRKIIQNTDTLVSIISGRPAYEVYNLLGFNPSPNIWGSYGLDRVYPDGRYEKVKLHQSLNEKLNMMHTVAKKSKYNENIEIKPFSVALHLRGIDFEAATGMRHGFLNEFGSYKNDRHVKFLEFDGGIELSLSDANKRKVLNHILPEGTDDYFAIYMGDDFSDEEIFKDFRKKRNTLSILARREWRESNAGYWLIPPDDIVWFMEKWLISSEE